MTVLAPVVILTIWGGSYVWACVLALSAPGKPVALDYKTPGGILHIRAESYAVDWDHGTAHVGDLTITSPDGQQILYARDVLARGLNLPTPKLVRVDVRDVRATVTRLDTGEFDIQGYLPQKQGPPSQIPFEVSLNRADVKVVDLAGKSPFEQPVTALDLDVRGVGDDWIASAALNLARTGNVRVDVQSMPSQGLLIRGKTPGLELARIFQHFKTTPDLKNAPFLQDLRMGSLKVFGPVSVFIPKKKGFEVQTNVKAIGSDIAYGRYAVDRATFDGLITQNSARGELDATNGATHANFNGSIIWPNGVALGGKLVASSPSPGALPAWIRDLIPAKIGFADANWAGWLDYHKETGFRAQGDLSAARVTAYDQEVVQPRLAVDLNDKNARLGIQSGVYAGAPIQGAVLIGIDQQTLMGAVTAKNVGLADVGRRLGAKGLSGTAEVSVLLGGTRTHPTAVLQARGDGTYAVNGHSITGRFQAAGNYQGDSIQVDRFRIGTGAGSVRALGTISLKQRTLALDVDATNLQLQKLRDDLAGSINVSGVLKGKLDDPQFSGRALALGIEAGGQEIPFASADVSASKNQVAASNLTVVKGTGQATGEVAINLKNHKLDGHLSADNVLLNEYLGEEALGIVTIPNLTIAGTLDKPRVAGSAFGNDLVLGGIRVDHAQIDTRLDGTVAHVENAVAQIGEGTITATGSYDYEKKTGTFAANADKLSLSRITPPGKGSENISGTLSGTANATIAASGTVRGKANGNLQAVDLNGTNFGNGTWNFGYDGEEITGSASIGMLDRFLLLEDVNFDTQARTISAQVSVLNGSIQDLYASTRPFFPELSYNVRQKLDTVEGNLDATVAFSGPIDSPNFAVKTLEARDLSVGGQDLGMITAQITRTGTIWNVGELKWTGAKDENGIQSLLLLSQPARIDTEGDVFVDAELANFDLRYIGLFDPNWAQLTGYASASLLAKGPVDEPQIKASFQTEQGSAFTVASTGERFRVDLSAINVTQSQFAPDGSYTGGITANGQFFYRGLAGNIVAHIPFNYPFEIPDGRNITASLVFPKVQISDLSRYVTYLDSERSVGELTGTISIVGPKSNLALAGEITGNAERIAFKDLTTELEATVASVKLNDNQIVLDFTTHSSVGGVLAANLRATLPDLQTTLDHAARGDSSLLQRTPVQGTITAKDLVVREDTKSKDYGTYHATVNSKLNITGPAVEPKIEGRVGVTDTNILLPSVFGGSGPTAEMLFNPRFEISLDLDEVARFRSSAADVSLTGGGELTGSLNRPQFNGTLVVEDGRLNLPTSRIRLEEGGTLRPSYSVNSSGDSNARVDVNIQGRTAVTAVRFGDTVQRYDIRLDITGDLLQEGGLNLNATSDPPDLSKDEILALLGKTDVLQTIGSASGFSQSETEKRIRDALVSVAVPTLTESITSQIASNLGLEYLNIDYNAVEGASLSFAKVLGKGLVLQGRRQITQMPGDRKLDYDLRLTYRLPTRNTNLNRVVFSIGLDQDRPWKLGVEYGFRF